MNNFFIRFLAWVPIFLEKIKNFLTPDNWEDKTELEVKVDKVDGKWKEQPIYDADDKPKTKVVKEGRRYGFYKRLGWFLVAMSVMAVLWFFAGIFVGKFWFKVILSLIIGFVIGKQLKTWRWRILIFLLIFFVNMLYVGESIELLRLAISFTAGGATFLFFYERFLGKEVYPGAMLPFFLIIFIVCFLSALSGLFQDHEYYIQKQTVSVSNLQKEKETGKQLAEKFSFSNKVKIPESSFHVLILEKEEEPISQLAQNLLVLKVKNCLPAEYGRVNSFIRKILFIIFFLVVNLIFAPIATLEIFQDWIAEKMKRGEKKKDSTQQADVFSFYGMIQVVQDLVSSIRKKRR